MDMPDHPAKSVFASDHMSLLNFSQRHPAQLRGDKSCETAFTTRLQTARVPAI
jgi:hypothetical protein